MNGESNYFRHRRWHQSDLNKYLTKILDQKRNPPPLLKICLQQWVVYGNHSHPPFPNYPLTIHLIHQYIPVLLGHPPCTGTVHATLYLLLPAPSKCFLPSNTRTPHKKRRTTIRCPNKWLGTDCCAYVSTRRICAV